MFVVAIKKHVSAQYTASC